MTLSEWVLSKKREGFEEKKIISALKEAGWDMENIEKAFLESQEILEKEKKNLEKIRAQRKAGVPDEKIKEFLFASGVPKKDIETLFADALMKK